MKEANPVKFYVAKYLLAVLGLIQWSVCAVILIQFPFTGKNFFVSLIFFLLGSIMLIMFVLINDRVKRVAVGKNKLVIFDGNRRSQIAWPEIKSLKIVPFFNLYKMKLKGREKCIYFFPSKNIDPAFGLMAKDTSKMGRIVERRKKEFGF